MTEQALQQGMRNRIAIERVFERERRHSLKIRRLKVALPIVGLAMIAALAGKSYLASHRGMSMDLAGTSIQDGRLIMANPTMAGYTADNRRYEMRAERATQSISDDNVVDLENIAARLPVGNEQWADVKTASGRLVKSQGKLHIDSPTEVRTTDGVVANLQSAVVDIDRGDLVSNTPVRIDMNGSNVTADSMTVTDGGNVMIFERSVKVRIAGDGMSTAPAAGGQDAQD